MDILKRQWWSAIVAGEVDIVTHLLDKHPPLLHAIDPYNQNGLGKAIQYNQTDVARTLVLVGADVNWESTEGFTPLMTACARNNAEMIKCLVAAGANINAKDSLNWSALMRSSFKGSLENMKFLILHGADVHARSDDGWDALMIASNKNHLDCIKLLLDSTSNINELFQKNSDLSLLFSDLTIRTKVQNHIKELTHGNLTRWKKQQLLELFR